MSSTKPTLAVVIASTRPGRRGLAIGEWIAEEARANGQFEVEVLDLAEINLPFFDEPNHPRLRQYVHEHTKAWSARVDAADAFIFVMPEYNHSINAPLKNAIDFLHQEWAYKPVAFVSYGGVAGGLRAVQAIKPIVSALKMTPLNEGVVIPMFTQFFNEQGRFVPNEMIRNSTEPMFKELLRQVQVLHTLRAA
jgi:NAD(P)H-dependent FMN reductase